MRVGIWDLSYYQNHKGQNAELMKISSYHKQIGDSVNLFEDIVDTKRQYELIYIYRDSDELPMPPIQFMNKSNVRLMGNGFKYFKTWHINDFILACRPDYLLYPDKSTREGRAEIVQLCNHEGKWLGLTQNFENSFKHKEIIVADDAIWIASPETINKCLDALLVMKNLSFLNPISLSSVLSDKIITEKFTRLKLFTNGKLEFINDYGADYSAAVVIADFLDQLRANNYEIKTLKVAFPPITGRRHNSNEDGYKDFERCLKIVDLGKQRGLQFYIDKVDRLKTPYHSLFEELNKWSSNRKTWGDSFIEFFTKKLRFKYNCDIEDLFLHPEWWNDEVFYGLLRAFKAYPMLLDKYGFRKLGDRFYNKEVISWTEIKEKVL